MANIRRYLKNHPEVFSVDSVPPDFLSIGSVPDGFLGIEQIDAEILPFPPGGDEGASG